MRKVISIACLSLVAIYLCIVIALYLDAKQCEASNGMFCGIGYVIAGFPWTWVFLSLADVYLSEQPAIEGQFFQTVFFASVLLNSLVVYFIARYVGNAITRRRGNLSSTVQPDTDMRTRN